MSTRIADARGAENLLVPRMRLMSRSLLAPEELREGAGSLQLVLP